MGDPCDAPGRLSRPGKKRPPPGGRAGQAKRRNRGGEPGPERCVVEKDRVRDASAPTRIFLKRTRPNGAGASRIPRTARAGNGGGDTVARARSG